MGAKGLCAAKQRARQLHATANALPEQLFQLPRQGLPIPARPERQFPGDQGRQAVEGIQQQLVRLPPGGVVQRPAQAFAVQRHGVQFIRRGGQAVKQARQHLALAGHVAVHPAQAVDDTPLPVQQDQIGVAAQGLQHQAALHPVPQLVDGLQTEVQQALHGGLLQFQNTPAQQVLAQQHAKHGRRVRVLPVPGRQVGPRVARVGREQQAHVLPPAPDAEQQFLPGRLIDLVDLPPQERAAQFSRHGGQAKGV